MISISKRGQRELQQLISVDSHLAKMTHINMNIHETRNVIDSLCSHNKQWPASFMVTDTNLFWTDKTDYVVYLCYSSHKFIRG